MRRRRGTGLLVALTGALALAGCSSPSPSPTVTETVTAAPSSVPASSAPASSAPASTPPASAAPSSIPSATSVAIGRCATAQLAGSWRDDGAAAGTHYGQLVLTNTGSAACTLQGWPGVSLVYRGNGTQLGAAAEQDHGSPDPHPTVRLAPGGAAEARVGIADPQNYPDSRCGLENADGLRVYPPGDRASLFVRVALQGCRSAAVHLLQVKALVPAS